MRRCALRVEGGRGAFIGPERNRLSLGRARLLEPLIRAPDMGARMSPLEEIESIKKLEYKYFRCLDSKRWAELAE
jgi:hypothetical protein